MEREILERAYAAWNAGSDLRARRMRCKAFTYGDQWSDVIEGQDGRMMSEYEFLCRLGCKPYTNNLIRQLVKTVVGRYRTLSENWGLYGGAMREVTRLNTLRELDARAMEEFLISGCAIQRVVKERRWEGTGTWVDNVDPRRFFVNSFSDPRGFDIELVGMLHDMSLPEVVNRYGGGDHARASELRELYGKIAAEMFPALGRSSGIDFFVPSDSGRCRVIEVWTFDSRPGADGSSDCEFHWHCRNYAPDGTLLAEYDSPYKHGRHPFVVKFYPLTDGEVHSFVEDVLDQQKFINRLIVMQDHILASSAKGALLYPEEQLPAGVDFKDIAEAWARADAIIPITGRGGVLPQQMTGSGQCTGAAQMLQIQMRLFEQVSGVGGALMGRSNVARGAEMLDSEVQNATIALADLFETFRSFAQMRNGMCLVES